MIITYHISSINFSVSPLPSMTRWTSLSFSFIFPLTLFSTLFRMATSSFILVHTSSTSAGRASQHWMVPVFE
jgi:hypothetical protein